MKFVSDAMIIFLEAFPLDKKIKNAKSWTFAHCLTTTKTVCQQMEALVFTFTERIANQLWSFMGGNFNHILKESEVVVLQIDKYRHWIWLSSGVIVGNKT